MPNAEVFLEIEKFFEESAAGRSEEPKRSRPRVQKGMFAGAGLSVTDNGAELDLRAISSKQRVDKRRQGRTLGEEHQCPKQEHYNNYWQEPEFLPLSQERPDLF